jgi:hypothetical protein
MSGAAVSVGVIVLDKTPDQVPSQAQLQAAHNQAAHNQAAHNQAAHNHATQNHATQVQVAQLQVAQSQAEVHAAQIEAAQIEARNQAANRTLEQALARAAALVMGMSLEEVADLAAGRGRLVYRPADAGVGASGQLADQLAEHLERREPVTESTAAPAEPRTDLRAHRAARREPARRALGIDIAAVVERINACTSSVEVGAYLDGLDARFTVPVLREIARAIGPTVNATGRTKGQLQRDIVEGTAGFRERTAAMSGGAWG